MRFGGPRSAPLGVALVAMASACTGRISGGAGAPANGPAAGAAGVSVTGGPATGAGGVATTGAGGAAGAGIVSASLCTSAAMAAAPPATRIRRLTRFELTNTLVDLLGANAGPLAAGLEPDSQALGYSTGDQRGVSDAYVGGLSTMAQGLGALVRATAVSPSPTFATTCFATDDAARACADKLVRDLGGRAFRRPLEDREVTALLGVYDAGRATGTDGDVTSRMQAGLDYTTRAIFQSPHFIFRTELGATTALASTATTLTPYELASALSYGTIASPPDATLTAAAAAGALGTPDQIGAQARRLIASRPDRFKAMVGEFTVEWLGINFDKPAWNKDAKAYPKFASTLKTTFAEETQAFLADWIDAGSSLPRLLTSTDGFVNRDNAPIYGLTSTSATFVKTPLPAGQRAGILTQPAFLGSAAHTDGSSPVYRGLAVLSQLLCKSAPPVPAMVPPLPAVDKTMIKTTRQRYEVHETAAFCAACHSTFDPMGYTFESYDGLGQWRTMENGAAVDPSGAIVGTDASDGPMANAVALATALAASPEVQACYARQVFRFDVGRLETDADGCSLAQATTAYQAKNLDLRELLVALATSPAFRARTATPPGGP